MTRQFTIEELSSYNGLNGKPAYLAYKGKVYDVTPVFEKGEHQGVKAGQDLTKNFSKGPHQEDIFSKFPVVGTMKQGFLGCLFKPAQGNADLILRLIFGIIFMGHGSQKLFGWFGGNGWEGTMGFFTNVMHIPALFAALAILVEFFGGLALVLGLFTRPAALGLSITMLVAMAKVSLANGFFLDLKGPKDGIEYALMLCAVGLYFVVRGAGQLSLDKVISDKISG